MWSNQGTGTNSDGSAQLNLGQMTQAWMGAFRGIVALCLPTLISEMLTADYNVVPPVAANGQLLGVILMQMGAGGYAVTWDSTNGTIFNPPAVSAVPGAVTTALFIGSGGYWWCIGFSYSGAAGAGTVFSLDTTLAAAYNVTAVAPAWVAGSLLVVRLVQNGTGGWAVTWGAAFKYPPAIPTGANLESLCTFFGAASGLWELCAAPILGRHA